MLDSLVLPRLLLPEAAFDIASQPHQLRERATQASHALALLLELLSHLSGGITPAAVKIHKFGNYVGAPWANFLPTAAMHPLSDAADLDLVADVVLPYLALASLRCAGEAPGAGQKGYEAAIAHDLWMATFIVLNLPVHASIACQAGVAGVAPQPHTSVLMHLTRLRPSASQALLKAFGLAIMQRAHGTLMGESSSGQARGLWRDLYHQALGLAALWEQRVPERLLKEHFHGWKPKAVPDNTLLAITSISGRWNAPTTEEARRTLQGMMQTVYSHLLTVFFPCCRVSTLLHEPFLHLARAARMMANDGVEHIAKTATNGVKGTQQKEWVKLHAPKCLQGMKAVQDLRNPKPPPPVAAVAATSSSSRQ
jgi:hypothetical protein